MNEKKILVWGFGDAVGTTAYVSLVAWFMFNAKGFFGPVDDFRGPLVILLLFILSATITASLVLGKPIHLYLGGEKASAFKLLGYTILFLFLLLVLIVLFIL